MFSSSEFSQLAYITAFPLAAIWFIRPNISCLAPTSTPFVGSSKIYTEQSAASHLPTDTFAGSWIDYAPADDTGVIIPSSSTYLCALSSAFERFMKGVQYLSMLAAERLSLHLPIRARLLCAFLRYKLMRF